MQCKLAVSKGTGDAQKIIELLCVAFGNGPCLLTLKSKTHRIYSDITSGTVVHHLREFESSPTLIMDVLYNSVSPSCIWKALFA